MIETLFISRLRNSKPLNSLSLASCSNIRVLTFLKFIAKLGNNITPLDTEDAKEEVVHVFLSTAELPKSLRHFQLTFCYPEAVVENKRDLKIFKTTEFQRPIQAVVVDEAHFAID